MRWVWVLFFIFLLLKVAWKPSRSIKMEPYTDNIETLTTVNTFYRRVLYTTPTLQLVVMSLLPGEEIGSETHQHGSQFIRVEEGEGLAIVDGKEYQLKDGDVIIIPPGATHNLLNLSTVPLKMYNLYSPPEHPKETLQCEKNT